MTTTGLSLRKGVLGALALFICAMLALTGYTLLNLHQKAISGGLTIAEEKTRSVEDYLTQSLQLTELAMAHVAPHDAGPLDVSAIEATFMATLRQAPHLRSISLLDDSGRIVVSSNPANVGISIALDDYLPQVTGPQAILRIGRAWSGRDFAGGQASTAQNPVPLEAPHFIPILKTLSADNDSGPGKAILLVALNPDYFVNHILQSFEVSQGSVEVLRFDGTLLLDSSPTARAGAQHDYVVRDLKLSLVESGKFEQDLGPQAPVLTAYRASRLYPFVVVTHYQRAIALAPWRVEVRTLLWLVLPTLLLVSLLAWVFYRRQVLHLALQAQAQREQQISATVFDASAQAITIADHHANIVSVNAAFTRITGYPADEVVGRNPRLLSAGLQGKPFYEQLWRELLQNGIWEGEMVNRRRDGTFYDVHVSITTAPGVADQGPHFIGVSTDITERKQREAESLASAQRLRAATKEAQEANQAKSRFLATMSHEIRTPMNGILGMAQLLLMPDFSAREREDYTRTILTSGQSLLALLNDILDLSKIESGKLQLESTVFDPEQLLRETQTLFSGSAKAKNLPLDIQWTGAHGQRYTSDAHRLSQMLANLAGNALKFTARGRIRMEGRELERDADTALLAFSVTDTGLGIATDKLDLLFKPFSQTDSSTTREYGGSGLGLSIVSSLADLLGGTVGVESEAGVGSRFWFQIRARLVAPDDKHPTTVHPMHFSDPLDLSAAPLTGRVLVVEDNPVNSLVITALLTQLGLSTTLALDGQQAVEAITQGELPDAVLMDLQMPVLDGYGATRQIRHWETQQHRARLPIIALTADAFEEDHQRCLAVGMDDFLTKPIALQALRTALVKWLPGAPQAHQPAPALRPLALDVWLAQVAEITPLLARNNFDALARFESLQALAQGTEIAAEMQDIEAMLNVFRFDRALESLQNMAAQQIKKQQA
jgi:PAS domain S-box-containing protein